MMHSRHARSTYTRTVRATRARMLKKTRRLVTELADRLPTLDDEWLHTLGVVILEEIDRRQHVAAQQKRKP